MYFLCSLMQQWSLSIPSVLCSWIHLMKKGCLTTGREWLRTQTDALDKLCLNSALWVIQIFNTALQDLKKICWIRGCKPGQFDILIHPAVRAAFNFPTIRCTWRLIWCFVNLLFCAVQNRLSFCRSVSLKGLNLWQRGHFSYTFGGGHLVISEAIILMH